MPRETTRSGSHSDSRFEVATLEEATAALDFFNAFHDGFMKRIEIVSHDELTDDPGQTCTGLFDVEIDFAHYNYPAHGRPLQPASRIVRARFEGARNVALDLDEGFLGNSITALTIAAVPAATDAAARDAPRLALRLLRNFLIEAERRWDPRECELFTFVRAELCELPD